MSVLKKDENFHIVVDPKIVQVGSFFIFIFIFFDFSKIYFLFIFFQKCHPAAGSSGGRLLPPDEPAVGWVRCGPWWAETYRRFNRR